MAQKKGTFNLSQGGRSETTAQSSAPTRVWFLSKGCKQVPPELIGGKILWGHPDGYFLGAKGQKLLHTFSPLSQRGWTAAHPSSNGNRGSCYPTMRQFGSKSCHSLMAAAFYGPRPERHECDHLNGVVTDYRPSNLQWVTPAENRRRVPYLRALREKIPNHAQTFQREDYLAWYAMPLDEFKAMLAKYSVAEQDPMMADMTHHREC
ncbi:MAG: HNH endonuclease [Paludibacteraceae bacterium]|nr:HNH endonuclease [Paludibacteraceae bacterium]